MKPGWFEISGVAACRNKELFESIDSKKFQDILKTEVSLEN